MSDTTTILWVRNDRRLDDNPALAHAAQRGPVIPLYVWSPDDDGEWPPGAAARWWIHHSLARLDAALRAMGSRLVIRRGRVADEIPGVAEAAGARRVVWNRHHEPAARELESTLATDLSARGIASESFDGALLVSPRRLRTKAGTPFKVFTPMWKALSVLERDPPAPAPTRVDAPAEWPAGETLESLELLPDASWADGFADRWSPGEAGARRALDDFMGEAVDGYADRRDHPGHRGTSRLSTHLHHGEIGIRRVWSRLAAAEDAEPFLRQLGWREFALHLLHHFPSTTNDPLRPEWTAFPWERDPRGLRAWQRGRTGFPIVDAGMRELWHTGWMHNRARMIVGSFLVKDLLVHWLEGARWFWDTLLDADLANNTLGWQWIGGCGADAAPFFRIFNPITQARRFDPEGAYVRRWVPELAELPTSVIHEPWRAAPLDLRSAGITLGETYPAPIVDHDEARRRALAAYEAIR